jgi:[acyl-carrier-protein] S-malonyltransferase
MSEKKVILCPGQGAQSVGMGKAWFDRSPAAAQTFGAAEEILGDRLGERLSTLCFRGPEDALNRTDVAQPAIYAVGVACYQAMFGDVDASGLAAVAGLSLGEYTALHLAGAISFADGLELVTLRGKAMQAAAEASDGGMVALIGADEAQAEHVVSKAREGDVLVAANFNAPGQIVLSGSTPACDRALGVVEELGLRASRLSVAGAFHSALMAPAADQLAAALARVEIDPPACPVVSNVTGVPHGTGPDEGRPIADAIRTRLVEQLTAPVRWSQSCAWLVENIPGEYHEIAPGKVLSGLMRRINRQTKVESHDTPPA